MKKQIFWIICLIFFFQTTIFSQEKMLTKEIVENFASLALKCLQKEYPNKLDHVLNDESEVLAPSKLHPAFYGCFDWHSAVHGTWLIARCLNLFSDIKQRDEILSVLKANINSENISREVAYLNQQNRSTFERPYGWAWLLILANELRFSPDPELQNLAEIIAPLEKEIVNRYLAYFRKLTYPIRTGVHPNSAFALSFLYDYAEKLKLEQITGFVKQTARRYYYNDKSSCALLEPGGEDFFSPSLLEAELMAKVLPEKDFISWFNRFFYDQHKNFNAANLLTPAEVSDRSDAKIVHLDGLNFSRSWCLSKIAAALPAGSRERTRFQKAARDLFFEAFKHINSGDYGGEHWLASFALYALQSLE